MLSTTWQRSIAPLTTSTPVSLFHYLPIIQSRVEPGGALNLRSRAPLSSYPKMLDSSTPVELGLDGGDDEQRRRVETGGDGRSVHADLSLTENVNAGLTSSTELYSQSLIRA
ncbi:hypothetical protein NL676_035893 [Syzygium grande]|nr:hypothetical protein NL676_035893 [Syzygium grande]